ncbi:SDR family NAD(P)-dependent oxidoreductase, partial [uncultured Varibaculum sp.]
MSWVLVTGASSGLGLEFCNQLAGRGHNVVMVARRENVLLEQAQRIEDFYG